MAMFGFDDVAISVDDSGGTPRALTGQLLEISAPAVEAILEETHAAGDTYVEQTHVGLFRGDDLTMTFLYDDTATTGSKIVFTNSEGNTRTVDVTLASTYSVAGEAVIRKVSPIIQRGQVTKLQVIAAWTGTITRD